MEITVGKNEVIYSRSVCRLYRGSNIVKIPVGSMAGKGSIAKVN